MQSGAFGRFLLGPIGSGKTTGVLMEVVRRACSQTPGADGLRRTHFAIVRNTLTQMKMTVLRDALTWLGPVIRWSPSTNTLFLETGDIRSEWFLIPLADPEDRRRLLSAQLTGVWINEFTEIDPDLVSDIGGRCGRFPSGDAGVCTWMGIVGDSNMPNIGSGWHKLLTDARPPDYEVFIQPGGLDDGAENLDWLVQTDRTLSLPLGHPERMAQGRSYYERLIHGRSPTWVDRFVHSRFGDDPEGAAVFASTFRHSVHTVTGTAPEPSPLYPVLIGQDFGRDPCSVFAQPGRHGEVTVLDELVAGNVALETHVTSSLLPLMMSERYAGCAFVIVGDPSGVAGGTAVELSCFDVLARHGLEVYPAPTNALDYRLRAVERLAMLSVATGPMLRIDVDRCPMLVRAMSGGYRFSRLRSGQLRPVPSKSHPASDLADCLQYIALSSTPATLSSLRRARPRRASSWRRPPWPTAFAEALPRQPVDPRGWT